MIITPAPPRPPVPPVVPAPPPPPPEPETTALSYLHAKELLHHSLKAPLCVYQASKSFRKEQDQANKHMRLKEFKQLEFQCIYSKTTKNDYQMSVINDIAIFVKNLLKLNTRLVYSDRLPSYSEKTIDIEVFNNDIVTGKQIGRAHV